jgi:hypothetical protein
MVNVCDVRNVQQQHDERRRWFDPRRHKPVDVKDIQGFKGHRQHTYAPPRFWLEAKHIVRSSAPTLPLLTKSKPKPNIS